MTSNKSFFTRLTSQVFCNFTVSGVAQGPKAVNDSTFFYHLKSRKEHFASGELLSFTMLVIEGESHMLAIGNSRGSVVIKSFAAFVGAILACAIALPISA